MAGALIRATTTVPSRSPKLRAGRPGHQGGQRKARQSSKNATHGRDEDADRSREPISVLDGPEDTGLEDDFLRADADVDGPALARIAGERDELGPLGVDRRQTSLDPGRSARGRHCRRPRSCATARSAGLAKTSAIGPLGG